jgi:hypothetical protein
MVNKRLAAFSRVSRIEVQNTPFEKTPTQKIKRFLYGIPRPVTTDPATGYPPGGSPSPGKLPGLTWTK